MMLFLFNLYLDLCFPSQADDQGVVNECIIVAIEDVCDARVEVLDGGYSKHCQDASQTVYFNVEQ